MAVGYFGAEEEGSPDVLLADSAALAVDARMAHLETVVPRMVGMGSADASENSVEVSLEGVGHNGVRQGRHRRAYVKVETVGRKSSQRAIAEAVGVKHSDVDLVGIAILEDMGKY